MGKRQFPIDYNSDIKSEEVSVVIQGTICDITPMTIASIRKYLPNAIIIISTWVECDVSGLDYDEVIINIDSGGKACSKWPEWKRINNINRQLVSSKN